MMDALLQTLIENLLPVALAAGLGLLGVAGAKLLQQARKEAKKTPSKADDKALEVLQETLEDANLIPKSADKAKE